MRCRNVPRLLLVCLAPVFGITTPAASYAQTDELPQADTSATERVLPFGELPNDARLGPLQTLNGPFSFQTPKNLDAWKKRANAVRRRIQVATGQWPVLERPIPNAVVHGKVLRDGYTIERVYLESYPGHFVTGSLYRPEHPSDQFPAILCPYGHWKGGRFQDEGLQEVRKQIAQGAERFEIGGRHPLQARCVQLARMGCMVFIYDMPGYGDSLQLSDEIVHRLKQPRSDFSGPTGWGLFSTQAELRLLTPLALMTYDSLCALDWVASLPEVDSSRIAVTGGSGGATQTLLMCALDDRIDAAFAAVMVSTAMQGGCTCENACCLRVGICNVDIAALFAPKPFGMASADDWTRDFKQDGYPEMTRLYEMHGASGNVSLASLTQFKHNYNYVTRSHMYEWFNTHLDLGLESPIIEQDFEPLTVEELTVWDASHPAPKTGANYERQLLQTMAESVETQMAALTPHDSASLQTFREVTGEALKVLFASDDSLESEINFQQVRSAAQGEVTEVVGLVGDQKRGAELPVVLLFPNQWNGDFVLWAHGEGKQSLRDPKGRLRSEVARLLSSDFAVVGVDLLGQGEFLSNHQKRAQVRLVESDRTQAAYTYGYNLTMFSHRVNDLLTLVSLLTNWETKPHRLHVIGLSEAGSWVAGARAIAGPRIETALIDTAGFRFADLDSWHDINFLPGAVKYRDLPGMLAMSAPQATCLVGEDGQVPSLTRQAYEAAGTPSKIVSLPVAVDENPASILLDWLLQNRSQSPDLNR